MSKYHVGIYSVTRYPLPIEETGADWIAELTDGYPFETDDVHDAITMALTKADQLEERYKLILPEGEGHVVIISDDEPEIPDVLPTRYVRREFLPLGNQKRIWTARRLIFG